MKPILAIV